MWEAQDVWEFDEHPQATLIDDKGVDVITGGKNHAPFIGPPTGAGDEAKEAPSAPSSPSMTGTAAAVAHAARAQVESLMAPVINWWS